MAPLPVGVLFPPVGGPDDPLLAPLHELGDRVELVVAPYLEDEALRAARSRGNATHAQMAGAPTLTPGQTDALRRVEAAVVMDLPELFWSEPTALRWVQASGAGVGQLRPADLAARGVVLTNASGIAAVSMSEFVMGRVLEVLKRIREIEQDQRDHVWRMRFGDRAAGRTVGIVGLGAIGRAVARRARAFDMPVLATRRTAAPGDTDPDVDELLPADRLDDLLARSDVVVISAPATAETKNLFDRDRLAAVKQGAILCNVARGSLVDEDALVEVLEAGHLRAAIIDVTAVEPNPPDSPLWDAPNLYLSPHSSTSLDGYGEAVIELFAENLRRYLDGQPLRNIVDPVTGY